MKTSGRLTNPNDAEVTITMTAPLRDWKSLIAQLPSGWPSWRVEADIRSVISKVDKHFDAPLVDEVKE